MAEGARRSIRGAFALLVGGVLVVAALTWLGRRDLEIEPAPLAMRAAEHAMAVRLEGATQERPREERDELLVADAPDVDPATPEVRLLTIEVRDSAARLVERSYVTLNDESDFRSYDTENGVIRVPFDTDPGPWRVGASIPGRHVSRPLLPFSGPDVVTVQVGDTGTLRVHCDGTSDPVDIMVFETRGGMPYGGAGYARTAGGALDMQVAAGAAEFRVIATVGEWTTTANTVAPRVQSDIVEVRLDFQVRRVTGQLVGGETTGEPTRARAFLAEGSKACFVEVGDNGTFAAVVPRGQQVMLVLTRADEWGICRVPITDGDVDVGPVVMAKETHLGTIEVGDAQGTVWLDNPRVLHATMSDGTRIMGGLVSHRLILGRGIELFAAPGVVEVVVMSGEFERFWSPAALTVRDGRVYRAQRIDGARVVVRVQDPGRVGMGSIRLQDRSTSQSYGFRNMGFDQGRLWWSEFRVPPGRYAVVANGVEIVGGALEVTSGREHEITVSVHPR